MDIVVSEVPIAAVTELVNVPIAFKVENGSST